VVYGMLRSLNPETASPYSYVLVPYIVGAEEFNTNGGDTEGVQVKAVDDFTVQSRIGKRGPPGSRVPARGETNV